MGVLRTILAIAVVVYHTFKVFGLRMCGGQVAVESFYMISGFYMALVLNEKYVGKGSYKTFILGRFYRLFPVYWVILLSAVIISVAGFYWFKQPFYLSRYVSNYHCLPFGTICYLLFENIVIIGQDLFYFLRLDENCQLQWTYHVLSYKHTAYQYLFVPQAWSISIECLFYLLAPFLVTKPIKWQLLIIGLGLLIRYVYAHYFYLSFDPWTYRFFPFELPLFMAGSMAYQYYKTMENKEMPKNLSHGLLILCVGLIILFDEINVEEQLKAWLFYGLIAISLPYVFKGFKNNTIDRYVGELSFSIYISHHLLVSIFRGYFFKNYQLLSYYGIVVVMSSIVLAVALHHILVAPLEKYRLKKIS